MTYVMIKMRQRNTIIIEYCLKLYAWCIAVVIKIAMKPIEGFAYHKPVYTLIEDLLFFFNKFSRDHARARKSTPHFMGQLLRIVLKPTLFNNQSVTQWNRK